MRRSPSLRCRLLLLFTALAGLFGLLAAAPAAAFVMAPGDNGDVKIHASTTPVDDQRDETHVCEFYLDAFNFDTIQQVSWKIDQQPPTGHAQVLSGSITLTNGAGHTAVMSLPAGHYKLTWTFVGEKGRAKFKVFWSTCAVPSPSPSMSASASASPSASASASPSASASASASPSASASASASASPGTSASGSMAPSASASATPGGGKLAETGGEAAGWLAVGGAVLAAGGALVRRTRGSMRHR